MPEHDSASEHDSAPEHDGAPEHVYVWGNGSYELHPFIRRQRRSNTSQTQIRYQGPDGNHRDKWEIIRWTQPDAEAFETSDECREFRHSRSRASRPANLTAPEGQQCQMQDPKFIWYWDGQKYVQAVFLRWDRDNPADGQEVVVFTQPGSDHQWKTNADILWDEPRAPEAINSSVHEEALVNESFAAQDRSPGSHPMPTHHRNSSALSRHAQHDITQATDEVRQRARTQTGYPQLPKNLEVIVTKYLSSGQAGPWFLNANGPEIGNQYSVIREDPSSFSFSSKFPENVQGRYLALPLESCAQVLKRQEAKINAVHKDHIRDKDVSIANLEAQVDSLTGRLENNIREKQSLGAELKTLKMEHVRRVAGPAKNFDYTSKFPSPSDLARRIKAFSDGVFYEWLETGYNSANEWAQSNDMGFVDNLVKQTLVSTVSECHKYVNEVVDERMRALNEFLGYKGTTPLGDSNEIPTYIRELPANTFREGHKFLFESFFSDSSSDLLQKIESRVRIAIDPAFRQQLECLLHAKTASPKYRTLVFELLKTFLECNLSRPKTLRFDASFGSVEEWNGKKHGRWTIDPRFEGPGKLSHLNDVQVVLPPFFLAEVERTEPPEMHEFMNAAAVLVVMTANECQQK